MEISEHHIRHFELIWRENELVRPAVKRLQIPVGRNRAFQCPHDSSAHSTYPVFIVFCPIDYISCLFGYPDPFRINLVFCEILNINAPEITQTYMQGYFSKLNTEDLQLLQKLPAEMQSCSGSCNSSFMLCKNCLVSFIVLRLHRPVYEFRKRCLTQIVKRLLELLIGAVKKEPECPAPGCCVVNHLGNQQIVFPEIELIANPYLPGRINQHTPQPLFP